MKLLMSVLLFSMFINSAFAEYQNINSYADHVKQLKHTEVNGMDLAYIDEGIHHSKVIVFFAWDTY